MTDHSDNFWRNRRVFITGHTGFKGSWLTLWLNQLGAKITGYSLNPLPDQTLFTELNLSKKITDLRGDISNITKLQDALTSSSPEVVIHMAAQSLVRESYRTPISTLNTNIIGTANLLESIRHVDSVRAVLIVTSDKSYKNTGKLSAYIESDHLGGHDPYSASKACAEIVASSYRDSFFSANNGASAGIATARSGNVIGGGDWAKDRLIPDAMRAFAQGQPLIIRAPTATRPWQHVLEPLSGYLLLCKKLWDEPKKYSGAWNFGPDPSGIMPVEHVVSRLVDLYGHGACWHHEISSNHMHEAELLSLNISKAREKLGWSPRWNLELTLMETVDWYQQKVLGQTSVSEVTIQQIQRYGPLD
mgnify:FL=1